ncbi:MAG: hypothetical protein FJY56_15645 [Betaproteobacteria bacterium]|nr:hypothetical protein [Betaproteobacteria bacterium]
MGKPAAAPPGAGLSWDALVRELGVAGVTRQLAQHCEMMRLDATQIELNLPKAQESMLGAHQVKLKAALQQRFGAAFKVVFNVTQEAINSPAVIASREQQAQQAQAERDIENDPFVQELVQGFGARIKPSSIKPNS